MPPVNHTEQENALENRISLLETDVRAMQMDSAVKHEQVMAKLTAIEIMSTSIVAGNSVNCLKHQARLEALELALKNKAEVAYAETTRKSVYVAWSVLGTVATTIVTFAIMHFMGKI
jgi:hypothetical protein